MNQSRRLWFHRDNCRFSGSRSWRACRSLCGYWSIWRGGLKPGFLSLGNRCQHAQTGDRCKDSYRFHLLNSHLSPLNEPNSFAQRNMEGSTAIVNCFSRLALVQADIDLGQAGHNYSRGIRCSRRGIPIQLLHSVKNRFTVSVEGVLKFGIVVDDLVKEPGRVVVDDVIFVL